MAAYLDRHGLNPRSAFAVASGQSGFRHMERNGFNAFPDHLYMGRYAIMTLDRGSARTAFWKRLVSPVEAPAATAHAPGASRGDRLHVEPVAGSISEDAHEVERRLTRSKADRYRKGLSF